MAYRVLHISDIHLERSFASMGCHGELARRRRDGLRIALRRAGDAAVEAHCDAITIGGDLYEHDRATPDTGAFLAGLFAGWRPMPVFIAPGNHDPVMRGSLYGSVQWPENVHIFDTPRLTPVRIQKGLTLWGLGHDQLSWDGNPLDLVEPITESDVHVALFHGSDLTRVPEGKTPHAPFHPTQIKTDGFCVALCGHYHGRRHDTRHSLVYPGTPEPLSFDETGGRGPVVVDIDESGKAAVTPLDINLWNVCNAECDLSSARTSNDIVDLVLEAASAALITDPTHTLLRLALNGSLPATTPVDTSTIQGHLRDIAGIEGVQLIDKTRFDLDAGAIVTEKSVRGEFLRAMQARITDETDDDAALTEEAMRYGLEALSGVEIGLR